MRITAFLLAFISCFGVSVMAKSRVLCHGNYCYLLSKTKATYCQAKTLCQLLGGYLAEPRDLSQNNAISKLSRERLWIGLTDLSTENQFYWDTTDRRLGPFSAWARREPNNYRNQEDCTETNFGQIGKWNDINCGARFRFVCQRKRH